MKEILFRGKSIGDGSWVYGSLIEDKYIVGKVIDWEEEYFNTEFWGMVDPETVGQYTGLKDKNGTEIYEGDIIVYLTSVEDGTAVVETFFDTSNQYLKWIRGKTSRESMYSDISMFGCESELTIIGNIHDNPELMEGM